MAKTSTERNREWRKRQKKALLNDMAKKQSKQSDVRTKSNIENNEGSALSKGHETDIINGNPAEPSTSTSQLQTDIPNQMMPRANSLTMLLWKFRARQNLRQRKPIGQPQGNHPEAADRQRRQRQNLIDPDLSPPCGGLLLNTASGPSFLPLPAQILEQVAAGNSEPGYTVLRLPAPQSLLKKSKFPMIRVAEVDVDVCFACKRCQRAFDSASALLTHQSVCFGADQRSRGAFRLVRRGFECEACGFRSSARFEKHCGLIDRKTEPADMENYVKSIIRKNSKNLSSDKKDSKSEIIPSAPELILIKEENQGLWFKEESEGQIHIKQEPEEPICTKEEPLMFSEESEEQIHIKKEPEEIYFKEEPLI
ncbi:unnamed protein product [Brassicogethes aeneus]|uniref:C2H2-type domain-containing protein n=1 Tax=Brassicogethes aeneus TaxID=1431903 RepID=A0A9P0FHP1_BRAAE|nr:unnamed protein product [Brassicogethes aeneus]